MDIDIKKEARIGTRVVFSITGQTGEVFRSDAGGVHVFLKMGDKLFIPWRHVVLKQPRTRMKYPRPFRYPRLEPTFICHCKTGRVIAKRKYDQIKILCKKCGKVIGTESFPKRIIAASRLYKKAYKKYRRERNLPRRKNRRR